MQSASFHSKHAKHLVKIMQVGMRSLHSNCQKTNNYILWWSLSYTVFHPSLNSTGLARRGCRAKPWRVKCRKKKKKNRRSLESAFLRMLVKSQYYIFNKKEGLKSQGHRRSNIINEYCSIDIISIVRQDC